MPAGQNEPVAAQPMGIAGVVDHDPLEQGVGQRGEAHGGAGVAIAHLLHRIGSQNTNRVDGTRVDLGPVVGVVRFGQSGNLVECGH